MNSTPLQAFRSQTSPEIISIPTRHDPKSNQLVVLWTDIQQSFGSVQRIMRSGATVVFLTDENLQYLIPLRIAHQPDMVLEVVAAMDNQGDSSSSNHRSHPVGEHSVAAGSSSEEKSVARDVASLSIRGTDDDNQALVVSPHNLSLKMVLRQPPTSIANPFQLGTENDMAQQEEPHTFQLQMDELVRKMQQADQKMEEVLERIQQTDQQREHTQQQIQDQIVQILQTLQHTSRQHLEEAERITQQLNLQRQQWEDALRTSQQNQQQQFEAVQQRLEQLDQDSRQQIQHFRQHMQQQIDKALNDVHQLSPNAQHAQQQHEQSPQQTRGMGKVRQDHDRLSPKLGRREAKYAFNQFVHAQYRVQSVLAQPSSNLPIPRLFIILPAPTAVIDKQEGSCSLQFRLYFLCECGSYTMTKNCNAPPEVHLADHPGYDLENQDEFINKYRSYLLTMMHMVKHGVKARGLLVQPLLGLNSAIGEDEIMGQLVDDTITHLKEVTECMDGDTTASQCLSAPELTELKSHLKVKDDEGFSGDLNRMKIKKAHYTWICSDHLRECYELTLQQLRFNINTSGGVWQRNEVKVKVTSEAMTQLLYDDLGTLFRIQSVDKWRYITGVDLNLNSHQSASSSTTEVLSSIDDLESLSLDFGRLIMEVKNIFRGEAKDVAISTGDLSRLTLDDLEFIQQCCPTVFAISKTPPKRDDNRLVSILHHNLSITTLQIDCDMERYIAVVDLVSSAREEMLQNEVRPAKRTLELAHPEIKLKVSFDEESPALDMAPCINLGNCQPHVVEPATYNFIRKHGWSAITFVVPKLFSDRLAQLLDESMHETASRIARLSITPTSLTTPGLDAVSRVINQLQALTSLRLSLESLERKDQLEKALVLLGRHKDRLTSLRLNGRKVDIWLPRIAQTFPGKDGFPVLEEFFVGNSCWQYLRDTERQWIASMASTRQQPRTPLKVFGVTNICIYRRYWKAVILAIDLSTIEELHFKGINLHEGMKILADRIMDSGVSPLPLRLLDFRGTSPNNDTTREMFARIRERAPQVEVRW